MTELQQFWSNHFADEEKAKQAAKDFHELQIKSHEANISAANKNWAERNPFWFAAIIAFISTALAVLSQLVLKHYNLL